MADLAPGLLSRSVARVRLLVGTVGKGMDDLVGSLMAGCLGEG